MSLSDNVEALAERVAEEFNTVRSDVDSRSLGVYAADFGAVGDDSTDDTTALQNLLNATPVNGVAHLQPGKTYKITSALTWPTKVTIDGHGATIHQADEDEHCLVGEDCVNLGLRDITLAGPVDSEPSGTGKGILVTRDERPDTFRVNLQRVIIHSFGSDGLDISNPITSDFANVEIRNCGGHGFNIHGVSLGSAGTSVVFTGTFANTNAKAGYFIDTMAYCAFVGAAADGNGIGYELVNAQGCSFSGCGAEIQSDNSDDEEGYAGYSWKIDGGFGITLDGCFTLAQPSIAVWVTGDAQAVVISGFMENTPDEEATACIKTDAGTSSTIISLSNTTDNSLAGNAVVINEGGGVSVPGYGYVGGPLIAGASFVGPVVWLDDATTIATDASTGNLFRVWLGGNRTLGAPSNPFDGQECTWEILGDPGSILSLDAIFVLNPGMPSTVTVTDGTRHSLTAVYDAGNTKWYVKSFGAHTHDDRYYTESEVDSFLSGKIDVSAIGAPEGVVGIDEDGLAEILLNPNPWGISRSEAANTTVTPLGIAAWHSYQLSSSACTIQLPDSAQELATERFECYNPSGSSKTVTFASGYKTSTGITLGPYTVPVGESLIAAIHYSARQSKWIVTAATVSAT